jgi:hypothetical protein
VYGGKTVNPQKTVPASVRIAMALALAALAPTAFSEPNPPPAPPTNSNISPPHSPETPPPVEDLGNGRYRIGSIQLDKNLGTATFQAKINQVEGNLEYLLVTPTGSTHESLLVTEISPKQLHVAMLLLGAKTASHQSAPAPGQINADFLKNAPAPDGHPIQITASWQEKGRKKTGPVEDWIFHTSTKRAAGRGPWIYTGSYVREGTFLAELDGCFAALVHNPSALINNPRKGRDDDSAWEPHRKQMPPAATPVELTLKLLPLSEPKPTQPKN